MLQRNSDNNQVRSEKSASGSPKANLRVRIRLGPKQHSAAPSDAKSPHFEETTCQECTKPVEPDALFCESCHAPVVRRYCPKCSKLVPENSKLCPFCGAAHNAQPRFHKNHIQTIVGILAGIAFIAYVVMNSTKATVAEKDAIDAELKAKTPAAPAPPTPGQQPQIQSAVTTTPQAIPSAAEGARLNLEAHKLITEQRYAEAIPILQRAVLAFPEGTTDITYKFVLYNLGHSLRRTGRFSEAQSYLEKCVALDAAWDKARDELAIIRAKMTTVPASTALPNTTTG